MTAPYLALVAIDGDVVATPAIAVEDSDLPATVQRFLCEMHGLRTCLITMADVIARLTDSTEHDRIVTEALLLKLREDLSRSLRRLREVDRLVPHVVGAMPCRLHGD